MQKIHPHTQHRQVGGWQLDHHGVQPSREGHSSSAQDIRQHDKCGELLHGRSMAGGQDAKLSVPELWIGPAEVCIFQDYGQQD